jgi:hypothetical protein
MKAPSVDAAITQCTLFQRQARRQLERGALRVPGCNRWLGVYSRNACASW